MSTRVTIVIVALVCISACGLIGTIANFEMVEKVNERLPKEEQFAELGWHLSKILRLHREYRKLYPDGRLLLKVRVLRALMIACLLIYAWSLGFFGGRASR
jgi:hypothetical protein